MLLAFPVMAIFIFAYFLFPSAALANSNNHDDHRSNFQKWWDSSHFNFWGNNHNDDHDDNGNHNGWDNGHHNGNDKGKKNDCEKHPDNPNCSEVVSVPEFGVIPGAVAFLSSAGAFYTLRRRVK